MKKSIIYTAILVFVCSLSISAVACADDDIHCKAEISYNGQSYVGADDGDTLAEARREAAEDACDRACDSLIDDDACEHDCEAKASIVSMFCKDKRGNVVADEKSSVLKSK